MPICLELTGSGGLEEPRRGDLLFFTNHDTATIGDLVAVQTPNRDMAYVHRVLELHSEIIIDSTDDQEAAAAFMLTKGDNNMANDRGLYPPSGHQGWIQQCDVVGKLVGKVRHIGWVLLLLGDYHPIIKYSITVGWLIWRIWSKVVTRMSITVVCKPDIFAALVLVLILLIPGCN